MEAKASSNIKLRFSFSQTINSSVVTTALKEGRLNTQVSTQFIKSSVILLIFASSPH